MPFEDLGRKSHWIIEAATPARKLHETMTRTLVDLPSDVTPGARQVAIVTKHRAAQAHLLDPIMTALKELEALPDWSGGFLVFDSINTTWRDAPFKHYASFADFYTQELAETWGKWENLEESYRLLQTGAIDAAGFQRRISDSAQQLAGPDGIDRSKTHAEAGAVGGRGKKAGNNVNSFKGNSAACLVARLKRDHPDVAARLAAGEFRSARAAAREAGLPVDTSPLVLLRRAWKRASEEERRIFHEEIR